MNKQEALRRLYKECIEAECNDYDCDDNCHIRTAIECVELVDFIETKHKYIYLDLKKELEEMKDNMEWMNTYKELMGVD